MNPSAAVYVVSAASYEDLSNPYSISFKQPYSIGRNNSRRGSKHALSLNLHFKLISQTTFLIAVLV